MRKRKRRKKKMEKKEEEEEEEVGVLQKSQSLWVLKLPSLFFSLKIIFG